MIARYRAGHGVLRLALEGLTSIELDWRPTEAAWSVRDVVHHLEDAELTGAVRLRRLLTEDAPLIPVFDEEVGVRWVVAAGGLVMGAGTLLMNSEIRGRNVYADPRRRAAG